MNYNEFLPSPCRSFSKSASILDYILLGAAADREIFNRLCSRETGTECLLVLSPKQAQNTLKIKILQTVVFFRLPSPMPMKKKKMEGIV